MDLDVGFHGDGIAGWGKYGRLEIQLPDFDFGVASSCCRASISTQALAPSPLRFGDDSHTNNGKFGPP